MIYYNINLVHIILKEVSQNLRSYSVHLLAWGFQIIEEFWIHSNNTNYCNVTGEICILMYSSFFFFSMRIPFNTIQFIFIVYLQFIDVNELHVMSSYTPFL